MRNVLRLAVIATLLLGAGGVRAGEESSSAGAPQTATESSSTPSSSAPTAASGGAAERGAASMEPVEAIDEEPGTGAHREWVVSIWTSP